MSTDTCLGTPRKPYPWACISLVSEQRSVSDLRFNRRPEVICSLLNPRSPSPSIIITELISPHRTPLPLHSAPFPHLRTHIIHCLNPSSPKSSPNHKASPHQDLPSPIEPKPQISPHHFVSITTTQGEKKNKTEKRRRLHSGRKGKRGIYLCRAFVASRRRRLHPHRRPLATPPSASTPPKPSAPFDFHRPFIIEQQRKGFETPFLLLFALVPRHPTRANQPAGPILLSGPSSGRARPNSK